MKFEALWWYFSREKRPSIWLAPYSIKIYFFRGKGLDKVVQIQVGVGDRAGELYWVILVIKIVFKLEDFIVGAFSVLHQDVAVVVAHSVTSSFPGLIVE